MLAMLPGNGARRNGVMMENSLIAKSAERYSWAGSIEAIRKKVAEDFLIGINNLSSNAHIFAVNGFDALSQRGNEMLNIS